MVVPSVYAFFRNCVYHKLLAITMRTTKIAIGSDHAGFEYIQKTIEHLLNKGYEIKDFGTYDDKPVDYCKRFRIGEEDDKMGVRNLKMYCR